MKKIFVLITIVAVFVTTACSDFLSVTPVSVTSKSTLENQQGLDWLVVGMYNYLYTNSVARTLADLNGDVLGGNANKGSELNDQTAWGQLENFIFDGSNSYISQPYTSYYYAIFRTNEVLDMADQLLSESKIDSETAIEAEAEARFIRGIYYFQLIKYYGAAVPWVGLDEYRSGSDPKVANHNEGELIYIWDKVLEDFEFAYQNLPEIQTQVGRPNKWAALAFKTKVLMFQASPYNGLPDTGKTSNWSTVKANLENLIANGKTSNGLKYGLVDDYESLFVAETSDNTKESVFAIQQAVIGTSTAANRTWSGSDFSSWKGLGGIGFLQPSHDLAQFYQVDANGLPLIATSATDGYRATPAITTVVEGVGSSDLTVYMDPRIDINMGRYSVPNMDWDIPTNPTLYVRSLTDGGIYFPKKHLMKRSDWGTYSINKNNTSSSKNYHMIRVADLYLWYAEACVETGDLVTAREYLNKIRERAANSAIMAAKMGRPLVDLYTDVAMEPTTSSYVLENKFDNTTTNNTAGNYRLGPWGTFANAAEAKKAIQYESRAEFAMEGRYWFDLCRWGIVANELNNYTAFESKVLTKLNSSLQYLDSWTYYPMPTTEMNTMEGKLIQNYNYSK